MHFFAKFVVVVPYIVVVWGSSSCPYNSSSKLNRPKIPYTGVCLSLKSILQFHHFNKIHMYKILTFMFCCND